MVFGFAARRVRRYHREIRIHKSKKNRQHNGKKKKYKRTKNDLQNIHIKLKVELHGKICDIFYKNYEGCTYH